MFKKGLLLAVFFAVIDQAHKYYMLEVFNIAQLGRVEVTSYFNLVMVWNCGVSFGMFNDCRESEYQPIILSVLTGAIAVLLTFWLRKAESRLQMWGFAMVIGGAVGNIIDRSMHGAVADFFDFYVNNYHWPAFNLADSFICVGVFILVAESFFGIKSNNEKT